MQKRCFYNGSEEEGKSRVGAHSSVPVRPGNVAVVEAGLQLGHVYRSQATVYLNEVAPDTVASSSPWLYCNQHSY